MLFKILHGDASRISTEITPFHEGYCYVTHDGYMYVDMNIGTVDSPNNQRIKLNANQAESLIGYNIATILNSSDIEIPTSKAILDYFGALATKDVITSSDIDESMYDWFLETLDNETVGLYGVIPDSSGQYVKVTIHFCDRLFYLEDYDHLQYMLNFGIYEYGEYTPFAVHYTYDGTYCVTRQVASTVDIKPVGYVRDGSSIVWYFVDSREVHSVMCSPINCRDTFTNGFEVERVDELPEDILECYYGTILPVEALATAIDEESGDNTVPSSKAVFDAIEAAKNNVATQDAVVLHEAQAYTDTEVANLQSQIDAINASLGANLTALAGLVGGDY